MVTAPKIVLRFLVLSCFIFVFPFQLVGQAEAANITLSGTLYTDEGVTVGTSGKTIKIAVGTSTVSVHSTTTVSGGVWSIDNIDDANLSTTTPFTVWLDGDANDATTMVMGYSGSNITSIPLYYAFTIAHGTSSTATVNVGSYSFYDIDDDTDILYKVTATSTVVSSDLLIKQGVFSAPTTTLSISGNYKNSGTYTNNYGSIFLTGASKTLSGTLTGTSALYDLNVIGSYIISTTSASTTNLVISSTGSLTASSSLTVASNFANQGTFNSNSGTLYMENAKDEVITYLKGVDARGDNTGTGNVLISGFAIKGDYLYVAKGGSATACSQTVGAAGVAGCELQVYDISSSTNPTYVAGRDVLGDGTSATASRMYSLAISGNYLYVGKASNANPCSQTAGDSGVNGCEIQVYDISSSTNPIYVAGRDASGDSTGVGSSIVYSLTISGNYLYVGKVGNATACSQTAGSAVGCELMIFDISSSTNPIYVAGRDGKGDNTGAGGQSIRSLLIRDNYLYAGKSGSVTACAQTAGSAQGCELMVFDISSSTNPVYKAGRDSSGDNVGVSSSDGYLSMAISGNYLYLGKDPDNAACTQVAGSAGANGCEIQVYDISSSTNPLYNAGRDSSGSSDGVGGLIVNSLAIVNNQIYVAKDPDATACSQVAGFAEGCELIVFDISSTTNPVYIVGRDDSGSSIGTDIVAINTIINNGKYIYIGKDNDFTACSQTTGSAQGCELMIFDTVSGFVSGTLNATSSFNNLSILDGLVNVVSLASTTNFSVSSGATFVAPSALTVGGNYTNNGTASFNEESDYLYVSSTSAQTLSGTLTGSSILPNTVFSGSGTKTFSNNASTTNFTINSGATVVSPTVLTVAGDYTNNGTHTQTGSTAEIKSYIRKYLAGRDMSGLSSGVGNVTTYTMAKSGNYLYVGKAGDATACSQTEGSATGCELMVFDISTPDSPTYVAGRDVSGSATGTGNLLIKNLIINGNYLYVGKAGDATACSQTEGSAVGCELMVFDISSSTNPVYSVGRDSLGDSTGTSSVLIYSLAVSGNYLYVAKSLNGTACSQTAGSAEGCELMVFDISSPNNPVYKAGRDSKGDSTGVGANSITYINIVGNYLYAGKGGYGAFACSQTAGSVGALACELMVFDISSSTNPTYVAGRDSSGSSTGTGSNATYFVTSSGNTLYLSKGNDATACSQTAGSAEGCELMVFDISSSTNPTYVAGRDSAGDSTGVGSVVTYTLAVGGNYLYVGKYNDATACSQTAGSAIGCEIMVFDISSTTNPTYVAGRDSSGSSDGSITAGSAIASIVSAGDYLYVSKGADSAPCSQTIGLANGCELMVFDIASNLSGTMTGTSAFNNLSVYGSTTISNNASTTNLTIATSSILTAPSYLTVAGDLSNYGTYTHNNGTVILSGTNQDLVSPATTTFYNLTKSVSSADTLTFTAGGTYVTEGELTLTGTSGNRLSLRSSSTTGEWYIDPQATATVSYLDVKDSNNIDVTTVSCLIDCLDSGNNTNWEFTEPISLVSIDNYHFYVGQSTTTLDTVTITKQSSESNITSANDIRIHVSTSTTNFYFDISNTTLTFGGTASGKVSGTVSYEDHSTTLVINVTSDFTVNDTLTIAGIRVGSFGSVSTTSSQFLLFSGGNTTGVADTEDTKTINISGSLTLGNHSQGRASNQFSFQDKNDETMFTFSVVPNNENATITDMVITLSGIQGVDSDEVNDFKLYRDLNSDGNGDVGGGDELIDSNGILTINGQHGAITFSTDFLATSTSDYIVTFDTSNVDRDDSFMVSLLTSGVTAIGVTSVYSSYILGSVNNTQHIREGANAGGSMARIGDDAPAGNGIVTGGEENGGGGVGEEVDGENIAHDPNFIKPSATGDIDNEWTNPSNALNSDGSYATAGSATLKQSYNGFSFGIPGGNTILGIEVKVDASGSTSNGTIDVALSWDGGSSYTTGKATPTLSGTDIIYNVGGSGDTWGRSWTATEFNPTNFRLRVTANPSSNTLRLDALEVRVYHQSTGGGGGGGGGI